MRVTSVNLGSNKHRRLLGIHRIVTVSERIDFVINKIETPIRWHQAFNARAETEAV